jgi:hypothetical protein
MGNRIGISSRGSFSLFIEISLISCQHPFVDTTHACMKKKKNSIEIQVGKDVWLNRESKPLPALSLRASKTIGNRSGSVPGLCSSFLTPLNPHPLGSYITLHPGHTFAYWPRFVNHIVLPFAYKKKSNLFTKYISQPLGRGACMIMRWCICIWTKVGTIMVWVITGTWGVRYIRKQQETVLSPKEL